MFPLKTLAAAAALALAGTAQAQAFPNKPVTLVVTFAPGGNIDITARAIAPAMGASLGQTVIVENRAGAGGTIGSQYVARARPDGYTIMMGSANVAVAPFAYKNISYDPIKDFTAIGGIQSVPLIVTTHGNSAINTWAELKTAAAGKKGGLTVASAGNGTSNHLALERIKQATGLELIHVPYKGSGAALADVIAGQVDLMVDQMNSSLPFIRDKKLKAITQMDNNRSPLLPSTPTMQESGVADLTASTWVGLFGPAHLPPEVLQKLEAALKAALADPQVVKQFADMGVNRFDMSRQKFEDFMKKDLENNKRVVRAANITAE